MKILLARGAGFIGSHVAVRLLPNGHEVPVIDNLSKGKREDMPIDMRSYRKMSVNLES